MEPLFSNKNSFDWISDNSDSMMRFVKRIKTTEISPLVEELNFGKNTWKNQDMVDYIKRCISLFPENSLRRIFCKKIELLPTVWFKKGGTAIAPAITDKLDEAEDKYSLPCGYSDFVQQEKLNIYHQYIELYEFPDFIPDLVVYVYLAYVVIHEFSHLVQKPGFHWVNYAKNFLPDYKEGDLPHYLLIGGEKFDPCDWQEKFVAEALVYEPITTYSGVYRDVDGVVRIHEYMADYMSSYLMGFTMNPVLSPTPVSGFEDRLELKDKIRAFINAEAVIQF